MNVRKHHERYPPSPRQSGKSAIANIKESTSIGAKFMGCMSGSSSSGSESKGSSSRNAMSKKQKQASEPMSPCPMCGLGKGELKRGRHEELCCAAAATAPSAAIPIPGKEKERRTSEAASSLKILLAGPNFQCDEAVISRAHDIIALTPCQSEAPADSTTKDIRYIYQNKKEDRGQGFFQGHWLSKFAPGGKKESNQAGGNVGVKVPDQAFIDARYDEDEDAVMVNVQDSPCHSPTMFCFPLQKGKNAKGLSVDVPPSSRRLGKAVREGDLSSPVRTSSVMSVPGLSGLFNSGKNKSRPGSDSSVKGGCPEKVFVQESCEVQLSRPTSTPVLTPTYEAPIEYALADAINNSLLDRLEQYIPDMEDFDEIGTPGAIPLSDSASTHAFGRSPSLVSSFIRDNESAIFGSSLGSLLRVEIERENRINSGPHSFSNPAGMKLGTSSPSVSGSWVNVDTTLSSSPPAPTGSWFNVQGQTLGTSLPSTLSGSWLDVDATLGTSPPAPTASWFNVPEYTATVNEPKPGNERFPSRGSEGSGSYILIPKNSNALSSCSQEALRPPPNVLSSSPASYHPYHSLSDDWVMCERERLPPSPITRGWVRVEKTSQASDFHLRGGGVEEEEEPSTTICLRGGGKGGFSLFGYRPPKADAERGKRYLDESVGPMWMLVGGTGTCGTTREFMKLSRGRKAKGEQVKEEAQQKKMVKAQEKAEKAAKALAEMEAKNGGGEMGAKLLDILGKGKDGGDGAPYPENPVVLVG